MSATDAAAPLRLSREDALARAFAAQRAGQPDQAAILCDAILAVAPEDPEALHLRGLAAEALGDPASAATLIGRALAHRESPVYRCNLGMVLGRLGRHQDAVAALERALALRPDYPEAFINLGVSLQALRRPAEAEAAYRRVLERRPDHPAALANLGNVLQELGRGEEAVVAYEAAVAHDPALPQTGLGHALRGLGRHAEAEAAYRHEVAAHPGSAEAHANLAGILGEAEGAAAAPAPAPAPLPGASPGAETLRGGVLGRLGRLEEAVAACERALALRPDHPEALVNLGQALRGLGRLAEAEAAQRRVLAQRPTDAAAYNGLAVTLQAADRPHEALAVLDLAAALAPADAETQHHRAMLLLRLGRLQEGWDAYEWRFRTHQAGRSHDWLAGRPPWRGEPLEGRTILLVPEQGLGDTIQFVRYVPLVAARGGRVLLGTPPELARLLEGLPGLAGLIPAGAPIPPHDLHCPLLSLPRAFGTTLDSIPAPVPYLRADPAAAARWGERLAAAPGLRAGLVWGGNPRHPDDRNRSVPLAALAPLWEVPGVSWFSLQLGARAAELQAAGRLPCPVTDLAPALHDLAETAAALTALDLVITADTAVAHLAGALGRPAWVLLPAVPDWRWLRRGEASPWYPTMRLFRQDARRDWRPVLEAVAGALARRTMTGQSPAG
jgi:tetratricopeptide (TPR) repeat protein